MKKILFTYLPAVILSMQAVTQEAPLFPKGEKAPNVHHTGDVWLYHASDADSSYSYNITVASFAPGAKLDWHLHPAGQQLLITDGRGYYQERNQPVQIAKKGDVIKCTPGVEHWHAATPGSGLTYIAITGNQPTKWFEKVSEQDYHNIKAPTYNLAGKTDEEMKQEIIKLSKDKWDWMADKKADTLSDLFHEKSMFVHMGGSWGKEREIEVIRSGGIWYKKAEVYSVVVNIIGNTAILLNEIDLVAVVGGNEVVNPFMVTEVYINENGKWKMGSLTFSKLLREVKMKK